MRRGVLVRLDPLPLKARKRSCTASPSASSYELQVDESARGRGVGRVLMEALERLATTFKMDKTMLTVFKGEVDPFARPVDTACHYAKSAFLDGPVSLLLCSYPYSQHVGDLVLREARVRFQPCPLLHPSLS